MKKDFGRSRQKALTSTRISLMTRHCSASTLCRSVGSHQAPVRFSGSACQAGQTARLTHREQAGQGKRGKSEIEKPLGREKQRLKGRTKEGCCCGRTN